MKVNLTRVDCVQEILMLDRLTSRSSGTRPVRIVLMVSVPVLRMVVRHGRRRIRLEFQFGSAGRHCNGRRCTEETNGGQLSAAGFGSDEGGSRRIKVMMMMMIAVGVAGIRVVRIVGTALIGKNYNQEN